MDLLSRLCLSVCVFGLALEAVAKSAAEVFEEVADSVVIVYLKDDKGQIWLIVCLEDAQVDLKAAPATDACVGDLPLADPQQVAQREQSTTRTDMLAPFAQGTAPDPRRRR